MILFVIKLKNLRKERFNDHLFSNLIRIFKKYIYRERMIDRKLDRLVILLKNIQKSFLYNVCRI